MEIRKLASIANKLDSLGLTKEADVIDRYISKIAIEWGYATEQSIGKVNIFAAEHPDLLCIISDDSSRAITKPLPKWLNPAFDSNLLLVKGRWPNTDELNTLLSDGLKSNYLEYIGTAPMLEVVGGKVVRNPKNSAEVKINTFSGLKRKYAVRFDKSSPAPRGNGNAGGGGKTPVPGPKPGPVAGGDSWAKYIATAKDPKTGKVNTELNTRVKQVWQSTNPSDKEFSGFISWYTKQKSNMSGLELTAKDFGQEQAIALIQTTGGSGKGWEGSDAALASIYKDIVISQNPASFNPSSVGLGRSGAGYAADLKGYKPTSGRSADAAKALIRSQMAGPAEQEYAGTATKFKDDSEFMFDPGVEEQMAARRSQKPQGMQGADSAAELARRTRNLAGERKTELED